MTDPEERLEKLRSWRDGEYELDEDEGYRCIWCGYRGLTAPLAPRYVTNTITVCPECRSPFERNR